MNNRILKLSVLLIPMLVFLSCASGPSYPVFEGEPKIAVVSYFLNNSIVGEGAEPDTGPGVLLDREEYYKYQQICVNEGWEHFKQNLPTIFPDMNFVDPLELEASEEYYKATRVRSIKAFGKEISPLKDYVFPPRINYINHKNDRTLAKLTNAITADLFMFIENKASYSPVNPRAVGDIDGKEGLFILSTTITITDPSGKVLWRERYRAKSAETAFFVFRNIPNNEYPRLYISAQEQLFEKIIKSAQAE